MKLTELVASTKAYLDRLRILDGYFNEMQSSMTFEEHQQLFADFPAVLLVSVQWTQMLLARYHRDPEWVQPVGELLRNGAQILGPAVIAFCAATQHHGELVQQLAASSPAFADDLHDVQELMHTDFTLAAAIAAVAEQTVTYQQIIAFVANATPIFHADRDMMLEARNLFDNISTKALARQAMPTFVVSHAPSRSRSQRSSVRYSAVFNDVFAEEIAREIGAHLEGTSVASPALASSPMPRQTSSSHVRAPPSRQSSIAEDDEETRTPTPTPAPRPTPTPAPRPTPTAAQQPFAQAGRTDIPPWLFGAITQAEAEALLMTDATEGRFLVRMRPQHPGEYVLSVVFRDRPTHHLVAPRDGIFLVNQRSFGDPRSLPEVVRNLSGPVASWPQVLTSFVSA
jgi:hypothetical protein